MKLKHKMSLLTTMQLHEWQTKLLNQQIMNMIQIRSIMHPIQQEQMQVILTLLIL